jgi:hypothetical protein
MNTNSRNSKGFVEPGLALVPWDKFQFQRLLF